MARRRFIITLDFFHTHRQGRDIIRPKRRGTSKAVNDGGDTQNRCSFMRKGGKDLGDVGLGKVGGMRCVL